MLRFLVSRIFQAVPTLLLVTGVVFMLIHLIPGDPVSAMLGAEASSETAEQLRHKLGLDQPIHVQYLLWLGHAAQGDLGRSVRTNQPVIELLFSRFPATLELASAALVTALLVGIPAGIFAARSRRTWTDTVISTLALVGITTPPFFLGILLIFVLSLHLRLLPPGGFVPLLEDPVRHLTFLLMPALALSLQITGIIAKITRSSVLGALEQDFVRTARAKGLAERWVVTHHALRNALIPVITIVGLQAGTLLGGAVISETIFSWPGIGKLALDAILMRDFPVIQGVVFLAGVAYILANLIADACYGLADPRIRV